MAKDEREREASHSVLFASKDSVSQWLDGWSRQWKWNSKAVAEERGRGSLLASELVKPCAVWPGYVFTTMPRGCLKSRNSAPLGLIFQSRAYTWIDVVDR